MAYTLKSTTLTAKLQFLCGVDEDGVLKDFKGATVSQSTSIPEADRIGDGSWNGTSRKWFRTSGSGSTAYPVTVTGGPTGYWGSNAPPTQYAMFIAVHSMTTGSTLPNFFIKYESESTGPTTGGLRVVSSTRLSYTSTIPTDGSASDPDVGTKYSIAGNWDRSNATEVYYGVAGNSITAADNTGTDTGNGSNQAIQSIGGISGGSSWMHARLYLVAQFSEALTLSEVQALHDDPYAELFEAPAAASRKLKILTHPSAQSAAGVAGVVFNSPSGSDITGTTRYGEFTGKSFESSLESGQAVLKVSVSAFGGGALNVDDTAVALVRNALFSTSIISGTVIEE